MYSPLHKFAYHSSDHWRAVEAYMCFSVSLYSNLTNPLTHCVKLSVLICCLSFEPPPPPRSELWLVLSLKCTLLTSDMTGSTSGPAWSGEIHKERRCVRKRRKLPFLTFKSKLTRKHWAVCSRCPPPSGASLQDLGQIVFSLP